MEKGRADRSVRRSTTEKVGALSSELGTRSGRCSSRSLPSCAKTSTNCSVINPNVGGVPGAPRQNVTQTFLSVPGKPQTRMSVPPLTRRKLRDQRATYNNPATVRSSFRTLSPGAGRSEVHYWPVPRISSVSIREICGWIDGSDQSAVDLPVLLNRTTSDRLTARFRRIPERVSSRWGGRGIFPRTR